jgi:hypothetical protein
VADDQSLDVPSFTVYFEKSRVIDVVANKADAEEIGPKPPIQYRPSAR